MTIREATGELVAQRRVMNGLLVAIGVMIAVIGLVSVLVKLFG